MDEHSTSALQYGHLGKAFYNAETQTWEFLRTLAPSSRIHYTGVTKTTIPSPLTAPQTSLIANKSVLPSVYPELAACWPLANNETLSHTITTTSEICDPLISSLFDIGYAVDLENNDSGNRVVPIAAVASGECGNKICFRKFEEDTVEIQQRTATWMRVPAVGQTESTDWSAGGAPVRQICFARTVEEKATWMAARLPNTTTIFRPVYHRKPVPMFLSHDNDRISLNSPRRSRLDANPLVEISNMQTGGFAHADVTFNPWYQKQFAIVDERGNWSIWELSGRHRRSKGNWTAARVKSGSLPWLDVGDSQDDDDHPRHDGWAVIEWVGDVNRFIVSDRRCPMLYRIVSGQVWSYSIELGLKRESEWILDVKRSACDMSHVFILTTTRIFWLDVSSISNLTNMTDNDSRSLYPRMCWRHFRDPEDITLRLTHLLVHEDFYLILYSRLNRFVLVFQCPSALKDQTEFSFPDPFMLEIPLSPDVGTESNLYNSTQFSALAFKEIRHLPSTIGKKDYDPHARLIKLFVIDSSLAVCESIYTDLSHGGVAEESFSRDILWTKKKHAVVERMQPARSQDDFIVDDRDECTLESGVLTAPDTGVASVTPLAIPQWTLDYTQVYAVATGRLKLLRSEESPGRKSPRRGFQKAIKELEIAFHATLRERITSKTGFEVFGGSPLLEDIDQNARDFDSLLSRISSDHSNIPTESQLNNWRYNISSMHFVEPNNSADGVAKTDLIVIYDRLVNNWLANMPHGIPGRTRIVKEKIVRSVAADLALALVSIKAQQVRDLEQVGYGLRPSSEAVLLPPITAANDPTDTSDSNAGRRTSLPPALLDGGSLEAPDSSAIPRNPLEYEGHVIQSQGDKQPAYTSLAAFTIFCSERTPPRNVGKMLHHWQPGADPGDYSWQRVVQIQEMGDSQLAFKSATPKIRSRKKTPSSQGINMKESASSITPVASVTSDVREWGSQPDSREPVIRLQSSQAVDGEVPMTQVERGTFGGREAGRKSVFKGRKKKRVAGF
ncbi:hypothetical protein BO71DRAFT_350536 [Aspergillus ellipticus CBS 707.79]|uniref:RNA polymerase I-specific transcription initiation factor RRN6-like protein n=1 Tax=Aspergillus ellipticus CBS 707.79 TaxID=1448320 RepID=A0A319DEU3_9EURO|nr:hypothetical protein BO71DRAFT_350536 [Aspergillus ellipticus CBS 707.79]